MVVRAQIGEVEHGGAEAGIFVVDQPQAAAVVDEVGGQQVMVADDDGQIRLRRFELGVDRLPGGERGVGVARLAQLAQVVAVDVEHPEDEARAAEAGRHVMVEAAEEGGDARDGGAHPVGRQHLALDEARHHQAGLGMHHLRGKAGGVGGAGRHHLAVAEDVVEGEVAGDADDVSAGGIGGGEALVGDAARQRGEGHGAGPDRQRGDTAFDVRHFGPDAPPRPENDPAAPC